MRTVQCMERHRHFAPALFKTSCPRRANLRKRYTDRAGCCTRWCLFGKSNGGSWRIRQVGNRAKEAVKLKECALVFWVACAIIVYTYVLFPAVLWLISRFASTAPIRSAGEQDELPRVAMVLAAYNEEADLPGKLANTWQIDYPADRFELHIGSDGSSDATAAILRACNDPRLHARVFDQRRGKISVLNDIVLGIDADIIVMSDANTLFSADAVRKLVAHFSDPKVGCVSGQLRLQRNGGSSGEGMYWKYEYNIKRAESRLGFQIGCNGGNYALRRCLYKPLPPSTIVEDFVITMRVLEQGWKVILEPDAVACEPCCASSRKEVVRKIRIGAGDWQALSLTLPMLHPRFGLRAFAFWGHKVLRWLVPFFIVVSLVSNVFLVGRPLYAGLLIVQLLGILASIFAYNDNQGTRMPRVLRPVTYFYLMNYALLCGFVRFLTGTQKVTWERGVATGPVTE